MLIYHRISDGRQQLAGEGDSLRAALVARSGGSAQIPVPASGWVQMKARVAASSDVVASQDQQK